MSRQNVRRGFGRRVAESPAIEPMNGVEFQRMYDCGEFPERFWPEEIAKLRQEFADGTITAQQLSDGLDDVMGLTRLGL